MKYFAGLDLTQINPSHLTQQECYLIERSLRHNYTKLHGAIDYTPADRVIELLRKYVKLNLIELSVAASLGLDVEDFTMALAIYMLPSSADDPFVNQYYAILATLPNHAEIEQVKSQKYSLSTVADLWFLLEPYKDKLNITGFWNKCAINLFDAVNNELCLQIFAGLDSLDQSKGKYAISNKQIAESLALQIVYYFYILSYVLRRENGCDVIYNLYNTEFPGAAVGASLRKLIPNTISRLKKLPEQPSELADPNTYRSLLFRVGKSLKRHIAPATESPEKRSKVAPGS